MPNGEHYRLASNRLCCKGQRRAGTRFRACRECPGRERVAEPGELPAAALPLHRAFQEDAMSLRTLIETKDFRDWYLQEPSDDRPTNVPPTEPIRGRGRGPCKPGT